MRAERVTEERTRARESAREVGVAAWRLRGIQTRRGEGRQAEREEVARRGGARGTQLLGEEEKTTEEEAAGPGWPAGPARPHRSWAAGKSPSFISFSIFLTYVLI